MSTINYTYNVIVDRFRQFAAGHFQLRRFTHGEISQADLEKEAEWPWLHIKPRGINYAAGTRAFSFEVFISDLPRDKEDKTGYQAESITDCSLIFQDLINEIYLGNMFGDQVELTRPVSAEPFVEQYTHTLTGVTGVVELNLDYDWSACSIPASWNYNTPTDSPSDGWGALQFIESLDQNGVFVSLVNDQEEPAANYYYGTDDEGVKGWHALDAGGLTCETLPECATIISILEDIEALQTDVALKANTADLGATAFSNDYNDLDNLPTIPAAQIQSDWTQTNNAALDFIKNKPTIPAAQVNSDWNATSGVAEILNKPTIPSTSGFVPYTGATADLNLGTYNLTADHIALNVSPSGAGFVVGATEWNNTIGSSQTLLKGGNVTLKNGVDLVARVVNKVTPNTTLTKAAYQAVRVSGAQGQRLAVAFAQANNDNNSADTIGLVCETIATNQEGFILTVGQLESINTTGSLQGETWADGDVLYLSPTTAGKLTNIKPTGATGHIVVIGYVEYAHANNGAIYVKIMNGWELDELHNVYINAPANNQGLFYDSADSLWKNETIASALGYTPENTANKQNSLAVDGTAVKFPTVDAVNNLSLIDKYKRGIQYFTDLEGAASALPYFSQLTSGSGATTNRSVTTIPNSTINQIGFAQYQTGTTATGYANHFSEANIGTQFFFGGGAWVFETYLNVETLSDATNRFRFVTGFGNSATNGAESNGAFFTYDEGGTQNGTAATPNWQTQTCVGSVRTLTTTSVAVTAGAWTKLRIEVNAAGTSVTFYINGNLVSTHTTNIPTWLAPNNPRGFNVKQSIVKTIGITNRNVFCDYFGYENRLTTPRT